nr:HNH endonuclease signature motif containing protein [Microbacterium hydrocarbonoxydans]
MPTRTRALLDQAASCLDEVLSGAGLVELSDAERIDVLVTAGAAFRRVEAVVIEALATAALTPTDLAHAAGCRTENELLQRTLLTDVPGATRFGKVMERVHRDVSLVSGDRLPARWPALREALLEGALTVEGFLAAVGPVEKCADRITLEERLVADEFLADQARGVRDADAGPEAPRGPKPTPADLHILAQALAALLDPDGAEPEDENAQHRRGVTIGRVKNGLRSIRGWLSPEVAAQVEAIFDAINNPARAGAPDPGVRFRPTGGSDSDRDVDVDVDGGADVDSDADLSDRDDSRGGFDPAAEGIPDSTDRFNCDPRAVIDPRTADQKRHDAFAAAISIAARHATMPTIGGAAPTLVVTIDAKDLANGTGWARLPGAHGHPFAHAPARVAAQTGCTGTIQRVILDEGRIIGISTTQRVFTAHQRRAIIARDHECLIPGCHTPASWCEIHHVTAHAHGGPTHTDNGVPLCYHHHRSLDGSGWEIRMTRGIPHVRGPAWWDPHQHWHTPNPSLLTSRLPPPIRPTPKRAARSRPNHATARAG